jgi:spermidine synthase
MIGGEIQSIYFPGGDWSPASREYWGRALVSARTVRPRPRVLLVGLGGGTQVHLLRGTVAPRLITVVEHDPVVVRVAHDWFGLDALGGIELLCADAAVALRYLTEARRRFDFVVDDVSYAAPVEVAIARARRLASLLAPGGVLVLNQHRRPAAQALARAISDLLPSVRLERVRPSVENVLVIAPRPPGRPPPVRVE